MPQRHRPRMIAPRLASGDRRETFGHGLPPAIKAGLRKIAAHENKSMSWVMEEVIIRYLNLKTPEYVQPKDAPATVPPPAARRSRAAVAGEAASVQ